MSAPALPVSVSVEQLVLGAAILYESAFHDLRPVLVADDLSLEKHRRILKHAFRLYDAGQRVDIVTLGIALRDAGDLDAVGGLTYLTSLTDGLPQFPDLSAYVRALKDDAARRRIIT